MFGEGDWFYQMTFDDEEDWYEYENWDLPPYEKHVLEFDPEFDHLFGSCEKPTKSKWISRTIKKKFMNRHLNGCSPADRCRICTLSPKTKKNYAKGRRSSYRKTLGEIYKHGG